MYDPWTVAHEIRLPIKTKRSPYGLPFITIWHVDPEKRTLGTRRDDSCGWFSPPYTQEQRDEIAKLAKNQYSQIFAKQVAYAEGKSYAYVCHNQDCYGAIYWSWRALKAQGKKGWQYGKPLSAKELDEIYKLATNPVDNFQRSVIDIKDYASFESFFIRIWQLYLRFNRPWYKHPRWHIHHWKIQFHTWRQLKRRYWDKCSVCGKRGFKESAIGDWGGNRIWHSSCDRSTQNAPVDQNLRDTV